MGKTVAVVLATYNGERYIAQQLQSIVEQTYPITVVYIVDDGSKDSTMDICRKYKDRYSSIKWVIKENHGIHGTYENFCYGLRLAENSADYVALCDQDDIWKKDRIEIMLDYFRKFQDMSGLASTFSRFDETGVICLSQQHPHSRKGDIKKITFKEFSHFHEYLGMSMIFLNDVVLEFNKYAETLSMPHKSHDIMLGFFSVLNNGFYYLDIPLTERRSYVASSSNTLAAKEFKESGYTSMMAYSFFLKSQYMNEFSVIAGKYHNNDLSLYFKEMSEFFFARAKYIDEKDLISWGFMARSVSRYDGLKDYIKDLYKIVR